MKRCGHILRRESIVPSQELAVFAREDVVCDCCYREPSSEFCAEGEHERSLSRADRSDEVSHLLYDLILAYLWLGESFGCPGVCTNR